MTNQELFSQAIADAKTVRDAAVANAKAALEETFTPKIMSMLTTKLNELEEDMEEGKEVEEEGYDVEEGHEAEIGYGAAMQKPEIEEDMSEESYEEGAKSMEEMDLEEILAELEKEEEGKMEEGKKKDMEEAKETEEKGKKKVEEAKDKEKMEEAEGDDEITELTVDELKDIIRDVLEDIMGGAEEEAGEEEMEAGEEESEEGEDEESIDLDELLAELSKEDDEKEKVEESKDKDEDDKKVEEVKKKEVEEAKKEATKAKKDLEEAIKVIQFLKKELNEVNLLNAKNTYVNKIFKAKSLSESQKVNVLKSIDKATNVKEAKVIYESLVSNLSTSKKNSIKESVGFASKAAGVAPKQPIVESDAAIRRMQQLAGIIK